LDALEEAERLARSCEVFLVVGTSGVVYPAGLLPFVAKQNGAKVVEINPESTPISEIADIIIREKASVGVEKFIQRMVSYSTLQKMELPASPRLSPLHRLNFGSLQP
jgi:NAD-dependent deacetylase